MKISTDEETGCRIVPKIKRIKIVGRGPIREADIKFTKGLNIIIGPNASGKSEVLRSITYALLIDPEENSSFNNICKTFKGSHESVDIELYGDYCSVTDLGNMLSAGERILLLTSGIANMEFDKCFLIDDFFARLDEDYMKRALAAMSKSKDQFIITLPEHAKLPKVKANIIRTRNFKLKKFGQIVETKDPKLNLFAKRRRK